MSTNGHRNVGPIGGSPKTPGMEIDLARPLGARLIVLVDGLIALRTTVGMLNQEFIGETLDEAGRPQRAGM